MDAIDGSTVLADVLIPGGRVADVTISDGVVRHIGASGKASVRIRCAGFHVLPAGVDMHVHMRDGLQAYKEDWKTGTHSALAGGVTVVIDQPNTLPPLTTVESFEQRVRLAAAQSCCHFGINAGVTPGADIEGMSRAGAMAFGETFAGPSSFGEAVGRDDLRMLMERITGVNGLITIHAETVREGRDINLAAHHALRAPAGETDAIRMVRMLAPAGAHIHFCHISSSDSVREIRTIPGATSEVTPHHLFLSLDRLPPYSGFGKVNPPVRTEEERRNLWRHWNEIDVIGSDHAPHSVQDKTGEFSEAPSGIPGIETMIPLFMAQVLKKRITLTDLIRKTSETPARILGIPEAGFMPGMRGDFALYPDEPGVVRSEDLHSKAGWTPFEGMEAVFPVMVVLGGAVAFDQDHVTFTTPEWMKGRGYKQSV